MGAHQQHQQQHQQHQHQQQQPAKLATAVPASEEAKKSLRALKDAEGAFLLNEEERTYWYGTMDIVIRDGVGWGGVELGRAG